MEDRKNEEILLLDEELSLTMVEKQCAALKPIITEFMESYARNQDKSVGEWLGWKMQQSFPDKKEEEIQDMAKGILADLGAAQEKKRSLEKAVENGISKESWFASETKKAVSAMSAQETVKYLSGLDEALKNANEALERTIKTNAGVVSQNPNLDGFIAEQYHAQTFNLNAEAGGSQYRARVLEPDGKRYAKNSVDVAIFDKNGKPVKKYQSKYYKDASGTSKAAGNGNYNSQRMLTAPEQAEKVQEYLRAKGSKKTVTDHIEAPDGTASIPLTKADAKQMQNNAQSGKMNEFNWNDSYQTKTVATKIAKKAGYAAVQGAVIGVGFDLARKMWNGEEINGEEIVETALTSSADSGIKAAAAGAIKLGAEKGLVSSILKDTSAAANVAFVAIENAKVAGQVMSGELSGKEGIEKMEQTTVATVAGLSAAGKGAVVGEVIGAVFGPVGIAIGGFIGGTVAYIAGSKVGETIVKGAQKLRDGAVKVVKMVAEGVCNFVGGVCDFVGDVLFGWL